MKRNNRFARIEANPTRLSISLKPILSRTCIALLLMLAIFSCTLAPLALAGNRSDGGQVRPLRVKPFRSTAQGGDTITIYGPRRFDRLPGPPVTVTEQFGAPFGIIAPFTLHIQNGAPDGTGRVSSATIHLNGVELFTQNEIKDSTPALSQVVSLQPLNTLQVKLSSAVGSFLTIHITGVRPVQLQASLQSIAPTRANQGQTVSVTLQGENTHWLAGQTRASFGQEVSVGGAAAGELGPITVTSLTSAIAQVSVSSTAALSPRTVRVVTPNVPVPFPLNFIEESVTLVDGFTVVATSTPSPSSTNVATIAGLAGSPGFADGVASQARFNNLAGLATGLDDSIVVADAGNNRIRVVRDQPDSSGASQWVVSTLAGDGTAGFADGPGTVARFKNPQGVAVDSYGIVLVADTSNNRIRKIAIDGTVTTIAGDGTAGLLDGVGAQARFNSPRGLAVDAQGNIYVADTGNAAVRVINSSGQVSTLAGDGTIGSNDSPGARFDCPSGVAVNGPNVYVYLTDKGNHRIRRLDSTGTVITIAGSARGFADGSASEALFAEPSGITFDGSGKILVTDTVNSLIRQVDPVLAANGSSGAVRTVAGAGERGQTDGPGSVARFLTPRGITATASSAIVVADTGNHTLRRLTLPPFISSISPPSAHPSETVTIDGERFDARGPNRNAVRFTRSVEAGGGQTIATVTSATHTSLIVVVPEDAANGPVTVQTEGGTAVGSTSFEVLPRIPVFTDFTPVSAPVGAAITLNGQWLKSNNGDPTVTFAGRGQTRLPALVTFASLTQVRVLVPNATVTGAIKLTNAWGEATTTQPFTVEASQDFQVAVSPSTATAVQGTSAGFVIQLTSTHSTFTQLARLSTTGLPGGVIATFDPSQLTAGATSTLNLNLSSAGLVPGSYGFTISAAADIDGHEIVRSVPATLSVVAAGQTTLSGRVLSTENEPIIGATISLDGQTATTNAAGSFLLTGVMAGPDRPVMIDGRTASAPNRTYPVLAEPATIVAGQANTVPYVFYLPPIDVENEVILVPGQTTVIGTPRIPGLTLTVPANANLRNRDNTPVTRISITPVPIDRTPTPLPPNVTTAMVYTNQPGGAISDIPMPMVFPNLSGADPGTLADLYAFNHDTVQWYVYGYGRVSADGRLIVPEIDPATGQPYGLVDFSWYFPSIVVTGFLVPGGNPFRADFCTSPFSPYGNSMAGVFDETMPDMIFTGARGGLTLIREYTTDLAFNNIGGRFGRGMKDNFDIRLAGNFQVGGAGRVIMPDEATGRLFSYSRTDADGSLVFTSGFTTNLLGDTVRRYPDGTTEYRSANGLVTRIDSIGRVVRFVDSDGNETSLSYTGPNLTSITDAVGRSITLAYDGSNRVTQATDTLGRIWQYAYQNGSLASVTDPVDNTTHYTYGGLGQLLSITDARGHLVKQITYNTDGRVREQEFADGGKEQYSYTLSGTSVTTAVATDSLGRRETKRFNAAGYVIGMIDALGQSSQIDRDITTNLPTSTTGPCGCPEATRQFDARGNITVATDRLGKSARMEYEPVFNNLTKMTDKRGHVTNFTYDVRGHLATATNALGQVTTYNYDGYGQLTSVMNPPGHTTSLEYDATGNVAAKVDELGNRTTFERDQLGRVTAVVNPLGQRASMTYDGVGRVETSTDASGGVTNFTYDANGNRTSVTNALGQRWQWIYDQRNRLLSQIDPLGQTSQMEYNAGDELITQVSPGNKITRYVYDGRGQVATVTDPTGTTVGYSYDSAGNLMLLRDQRGNATTFAYDELDRPIEVRDPLGQLTNVLYDAVGNVIEGTDRLGRRATVTYDALNRPTQTQYVDATVTHTYDTVGRLKRIDDTQAGFIEWNYDNAGRVLAEMTGAGTVSYSYNTAGQRIEMRAADRTPVTYSYDTVGRLGTITQGTETFTYAYDTLSRLASLERPNGVRTSYNYDTAGRLKRLTHADNLNQTLEDYRYSYTSDNQIKALTSLFSTQLLPAAQQGQPADQANRLGQFGAASYSFNPEGQTTTKTDGQGTTVYQWDARGRLTQATLPGGQVVNYTYDALGRRAGRTVGGVTTSFLYDGMDVVLDNNSDGSTVEYLNGSGNKLRQVSAATGSLYFLQDHSSSTAALTNASGAVVERQQYQAFGAGTGSVLTRYGYLSSEFDNLAGLLFDGSRWYDPQQGRFIMQDQLGFSSGAANFYTLTNNDPVSMSWGNLYFPVSLLGRRSFACGVPQNYDPRVDFRDYAKQLSNTTGTSDCLKLVLLIYKAGQIWGSGGADSIVDGLLAGLTELSSIGHDGTFPSDPNYRVGVMRNDPHGNYASSFDQQGFNGSYGGGGFINSFRDNQVRHFIAWFAAGYSTSTAFAEAALFREEGTLRNRDPDVALGRAAIALGASFRGDFRRLAQNVWNQICGERSTLNLP